MTCFLILLSVLRNITDERKYKCILWDLKTIFRIFALFSLFYHMQHIRLSVYLFLIFYRTTAGLKQCLFKTCLLDACCWMSKSVAWNNKCSVGSKWCSRKRMVITITFSWKFIIIAKKSWPGNNTRSAFRLH